MADEIIENMELLGQRRILEKKLNNLLWGTVEIREVKGDRYIYLHKRVAGINRSSYIGTYSVEISNQLLKNNMDAKDLKRQIRAINAKLKKQGYVEIALSDQVRTNIDFAKRNMVDTIYKQAVLEGVAVTFLDTETIIEGGKINNVSVDDIQKINNLKHAWQLILDEGVVTSPSDYNLLCLINKLVEEGFYYSTGTLRSVPVSIGGTKWKPELPIESLVKEELSDILSLDDVYTKAVSALLFVTKKQLFIDGNKRTSVIFANHILISAGAGLIAIPEEDVPEYKRLLIRYYETDDKSAISEFLYEKCLTKI
jgi:Fic family protein